LISSVDLTTGVFSGRALLDPDLTHVQQRLDEILDEGARTLLVAVDDASGAIVGLLVARLSEIGAIDLTAVLHVTHLLVAPSHRRKGIGRALLAGAVHVAEERGVERVVASAGAGSREANRYLSRLGFAPLVVHRVASTAVLRRSLGLAENSEWMTRLRRARLVRAHRAAPMRRGA
jgi:GNAT superfamily N-acetyltransferase